MNTGLGDATDLGWKLAATIQGWGGPHLLASYDAERRPFRRSRGSEAADAIPRAAIRLAMGSTHSKKPAPPAMRCVSASAKRSLPASAAKFHHRAADRLSLRGSTICIADGSPEVADDPETYRPSARPGMRAPHAWLKAGRSTLDLFGKGFILLCFGDAPQAADSLSPGSTRTPACCCGQRPSMSRQSPLSMSVSWCWSVRMDSVAARRILKK